MSFLLSFILSRMAEPSTWRGLVMLLTGAGVTVSPELITPIVAIGTSLTGVIGVLAKDKLDSRS
jgi:hypothetical protein